MTTEPKPDKVLDLLDVSMRVVEAALKYEAILLKPRGTVTEKEFKSVLRRLFTEAHRVDDMRVTNLQEALGSFDDDPDYQEFLRRN